MLFGDSAAMPPEANYGLIAGGDAAATVTAAAAGHQALADVLQGELAALLGNAGATAAAGWQGLGGTAMVGSAGQQAAVLQLASLWMQQAFIAATQAAAAHQTALASMIPAPVCTANLDSQAALAGTNFMGINTPAILALQAAYDEHWTQNASLMASYQGVLGEAIGMLATPPPLGPPAANPGAPITAADALQGVQTPLQASAEPMMQLADGGMQSATGGSSTEMLSSMLGQVSSVGGQMSSMVGQVPQLLTSIPSQVQGLFGQFGSMFGQLNGGALESATPASLSAAGAAPALGAGGLGAGSGLGGIGSGVFRPGGAPVAELVRPASSFSAPAAPGLPAGWAGAKGAPAGAAPSPGMGGGLFGAPGAAAGSRDQQSQERVPARALQLTASRARRGEGLTP